MAQTEARDVLAEETIVDAEIHGAEKYPDLLEYIDDDAFRE